MRYKLVLQPEAQGQLRDLEHDRDKQDLGKLKRVRKCLGLIEANPKHPGLHSHKYTDKKGRNGEEVWESYVENRVPTAWRVFWHYGPTQDEITILTITPHP